MNDTTEEDSRPGSPFLEPSKDNSKVQDMITRKPKIQRIRCRRNFNAIVTNVVSPGEIWIQIMNNIAKELVHPTTDAPPFETELIEDKYVMTPIDKDTLLRGRIIKTEGTKAFIRLIDTGKAVWRDENAIFKMPNKLYSYPWQSQVVLLHAVSPKANDEWSTKEIDILREILLDFNYVYVKPTVIKKGVINDDRLITSVSMIGMNGELQQNIYDANGIRIAPESFGIDIAQLYYIFNKTIPTYIHDVKDEIMFPYPAESSDDLFYTTYQSFDIKPNPNNTYVEEKEPVVIPKTEETKSFTEYKILKERKKYVAPVNGNTANESNA